MKRLACALLFAVLLLGAAEGEHKPGPDLIGWKWANLAILAALLGYVIAKNAGPFFASRSAEIQKGIEEAAKIGADADARAAAIARQIAGLDDDIAALRSNAKAEAEAEGARVRFETERDLAKIQANTRREIESTAKTARQELKLHAADLALGLARERVLQRMNPATQNALVEGFARKLSQEN